jgi:hypothetical protein
MTDLIARARAYVDKMPPAVAGQHGHDATFKVAIALVHGFGLSEGDAMPIMAEYSSRCSREAAASTKARPLAGGGTIRRR